jgi:hypothetical protein
MDENGEENASVHIDFDESAELVDALRFAAHAAEGMRADKRDYTELYYCTKDDARFGFYQDKKKQQAFVGLGTQSAFLPVEQLELLASSLEQCRMHLIVKGAGSTSDDS